MRALLLLLLAASLEAQTGRVTDTNFNGWFMYFGDHLVSKRWGVHFDGQWRRHDFASRWQQLLLRPGINFNVHPNVMLTAGYTYVKTHRYGDYPAAYPFGEQRLFQQVLLKHSAGRVDFTQRYRVEQRFIEVRGAPYRYQNRFRYFVKMTVPLKKQSPWFFAAYDEILLHFGGNHGANVYDHNRAYAALGYKTGKYGNVEIGYMNQRLLQRNGRVLENNHTFQLAFLSNVRLRK
ncbi:MAG: DUF2490 domain-containing protein [Bryobacterales bacterium]|nr:DUF2490 domain-containing protein [Bryobacterales bacterium]